MSPKQILKTLEKSTKPAIKTQKDKRKDISYRHLAEMHSEIRFFLVLIIM